MNIDQLDIDECNIEDLTIGCLRIKKLIIDEIVFPPRRIVTESGDKLQTDNTNPNDIVSDEDINPL